MWNRCAPSSDPSLSIKFYERTPEQQAALGYVADTSQREPGVENLDGSNNVSLAQEEPHGSVGARAGRRAIAQGNSAEIADSLFRYSAPEEVHSPSNPSLYVTPCFRVTITTLSRDRSWHFHRLAVPVPRAVCVVCSWQVSFRLWHYIFRFFVSKLLALTVNRHPLFPRSDCHGFNLWQLWLPQLRGSFGLLVPSVPSSYLHTDDSIIVYFSGEARWCYSRKREKDSRSCEERQRS